MDVTSDIDILVVGEHKVVEAQKAISLLQKEYDRVINVTHMSTDEFESKSEDPFIKDILSKQKIEKKRRRQESTKRSRGFKKKRSHARDRDDDFSYEVKKKHMWAEMR